MWVTWPRSPARVHTKPSSTSPTSALDFDSTTHPPPTPSPRSPIIHHPSISFKDIEYLLSRQHSLASLHPGRTRAHQPPASLKDVHAMLNEGPFRKPSIFHRVRAWAHRQAQPPPDAQNRIVVYYTSLGVIRSTFDDCRAVRSILKAYKVKIDERDLSMDGAYVGELQRITGKKPDLIKLPLVFINGKYLGGADEIRRLQEIGDLKRIIQGLPLAEVGICRVCGGYRFVVCDECGGSHRVYIEDVGSKGCSNCNENGLIRCDCCTSVLF